MLKEISLVKDKVLRLKSGFNLNSDWIKVCIHGVDEDSYEVGGNVNGLADSKG